MSISAMKQALDAITNVLAGGDFDNPYADLKEAASELRQAIAEAENQDPIAWLSKCYNDDSEFLGYTVWDRDVGEGAFPVYTNDMSEKHIHKSDKYRHEFDDDIYDVWKEKKEWIGLDHEMMRNTPIEFNRGALWAERYLKEKNT